jgi:hypothetical protein
MIPTDVDMEAATTWSHNDTAPDGLTRTEERFDAANPDDAKEKVRQDLWGSGP